MKIDNFTLVKAGLQGKKLDSREGGNDKYLFPQQILIKEAKLWNYPG